MFWNKHESIECNDAPLVCCTRWFILKHGFHFVLKLPVTFCWVLNISYMKFQNFELCICWNNSGLEALICIFHFLVMYCPSRQAASSTYGFTQLKDFWSVELWFYDSTLLHVLNYWTQKMIFPTLKMQLRKFENLEANITFTVLPLQCWFFAWWRYSLSEALQLIFIIQRLLGQTFFLWHPMFYLPFQDLVLSSWFPLLCLLSKVMNGFITPILLLISWFP